MKAIATYMLALSLVVFNVEAKEYTVVLDRGVYDMYGNSLLRGIVKELKDDRVYSIILDRYDDPVNTSDIDQIINRPIKGQPIYIGEGMTGGITIASYQPDLKPLKVFFNKIKLKPDKWWILSDRTQLSGALSSSIKEQTGGEIVLFSNMAELRLWLTRNSRSNTVLINTAISLKDFESGTLFDKHKIEQFIRVWNKSSLDVSLNMGSGSTGNRMAISIGYTGQDIGRAIACSITGCKHVPPNLLLINPKRFRSLGHSFMGGLTTIDGVYSDEP